MWQQTLAVERQSATFGIPKITAQRSCGCRWMAEKLSSLSKFVPSDSCESLLWQAKLLMLFEVTELQILTRLLHLDISSIDGFEQRDSCCSIVAISFYQQFSDAAVAHGAHVIHVGVGFLWQKTWSCCLFFPITVVWQSRLATQPPAPRCWRHVPWSLTRCRELAGAAPGAPGAQRWVCWAGPPMSETHYAAVRAKLNKHCYHQHLGSDSVLLAETMINDLIASASSLSNLQEKDNDKRTELQLLICELDGLRIENPRLKAENNALHLQILEAVEASETWEASICQEVQSLEDEIDSTKLSLQQETRRAAQKELELQQLQVEAAVILNVDGNATRPCDFLPERSAFQLDAEPLMAKDESLTESLYHCRRNLLNLESNVAETAKRATDLENKAEMLCQELFEGSTPSQPLRLRAMQAQLEVEATQQRKGLEELEMQCQELDERRRSSDQKRRHLQEKSQELHSEEAALLADEAKEAVKTMELLEESQAATSTHQHHLKEVQERHMALQMSCQKLRGSTQIMASRLSQFSRDEALSAAEQSKKVKDLLDRLVSVQNGAGAPSTLQVQQLEDQVQRAQEESIRLSSSKAALEEEVQAATLEAKMQARHLETQRASMEGDIQSGAEVQSRWSSAGAQLQWLNASLSGITDEHLLLKSQLQEQQASLHEESLQRVQTHVEVQRLQTMVTSLDRTREEWMADLSRSVASLRQAHGSLTATLQQEESVQRTSDQLRHQLLASERSLQMAAQQRHELAGEVDDWTFELHEHSRKRDEARSTAALLMDELRQASVHASDSQRQLADSDGLLDKVQGEVYDFQDRLARVDTEIASLNSKAKRSELVTERRLERDNSLSVCSAELAASEIASEALTSKCWQLQEDIQEKTARASSAEFASRKLEEELERCQHELDEVKASAQNAAAGVKSGPDSRFPRSQRGIGA
eukprot:s2952_g3.t1